MSLEKVLVEYRLCENVFEIHDDTPVIGSFREPDVEANGVMPYATAVHAKQAMGILRLHRIERGWNPCQESTHQHGLGVLKKWVSVPGGGKSSLRFIAYSVERVVEGKVTSTERYHGEAGWNTLGTDYFEPHPGLKALKC